VSEPIVYVTTWKLEEGRLEDYLRFHDELARIVEENEPAVVAFLAFANDGGTEVTTVHAFPDEATVERHMGILAERVGLLPETLKAVTRFAKPVQLQVFGKPGDQATAMDRELAESGVAYSIKPRLLGGFLRVP
jgi:hypothetical protein